MRTPPGWTGAWHRFAHDHQSPFRSRNTAQEFSAVFTLTMLPCINSMLPLSIHVGLLSDEMQSDVSSLHSHETHACSLKAKSTMLECRSCQVECPF